MHDKGLKQLWEIRFLKIFTLEKEGFLFYRKLLAKGEALLEGTGAKPILEGIMKDELKHVRIARELLRLVRSKKIPEERKDY